MSRGKKKAKKKTSKRQQEQSSVHGNENKSSALPVQAEARDDCTLETNTVAHEEHHLFVKMLEFQDLMMELSQENDRLETPSGFPLSEDECTIRADRVDQSFNRTEDFVRSPVIGSSKKQRRKVKTLKMKWAKMRSLTLSEGNGSSLKSNSNDKIVPKSTLSRYSYPELMEYRAIDRSLESKKCISEDVEATIFHVSALFMDIVARYRNNWQRDRELGYPGYRGGSGDPAAPAEERMKIQMEEIERLNTILPKLEDSYMKKLTDSWTTLVTKLHQTAENNPRKFQEIVTLIQEHLSSYEKYSRNDFGKSNGKSIRSADDHGLPVERGDAAKQIFSKSVTEVDSARCMLHKAEQEFVHRVDSSQIIKSVSIEDEEKASRTIRKSVSIEDEEKASRTTRKSVSSEDEEKASRTIRKSVSSEDGEKASRTIRQAVSSENEEKASRTIRKNNCLQSTSFQRWEQSASSNAVKTREVVYTSRIVEALETEVTLSSTRNALGLLCRSSADVFTGIPSASTILQVQTGRAKALTIVEDQLSAETRSAFDAERPDSSLRVCESRWDVLVEGLKTQSAQRKQGISGDIVLGTTDERKRFTISPGGNFGPIELGLDADGRPLAIRRIGRETGLSIVPLLDSILTLRHGHLLPFTFCSDDGTEMILGTPLCEYNLGEYLMCLKSSKGLEQQADSLVKQFLAGLCFLHTQNVPIVHGNMKPSNLMIDRTGILRLAEFGLWKSLYRRSRPPSSSMIWFAGESFRSYEEKEKLSCSCGTDIQVAGMITHFILTGGLHPYGTQTNDILENISRGCPRIRSQGSEIVDLVSWMLVCDPSKRPSINQVLTHVFFWNMNKKWSFLLACAGITINGRSLRLPLQAFHKDLEAKTLSDQIKGILVFIRRQLESQPSTCRPALQQFFLRAFPSLPLSLYRLLETTQWMSHPVLSPYVQSD